ncbi:MAG: hypothetical protein DYG89_04135 [Caldilinea sp. CFX5]|nr:hypothetical protein [Caldilinea sp. CFX5]
MMVSRPEGTRSPVVVVVTVQVTFINLPALPMGLLLPMRLVDYNGGNRRLVITAESGALPEPIVAWLQASPQYRALIAQVGPVNAPGESEVFER